MKYKQKAWNLLRVSYWNIFIFSLLISLVIGLAGSVPVVGAIAVALFSTSFAVAQILNMRGVILHGGKGEQWQNSIMYACKNFLKYLAASLIIGLFTLLWSLLFIIPGIIKAYSYSQTLYILAENPEMGVLDAITQSRQMMDGKKLELFILNLSFIGWILLGLLTFGIGYVFLFPYIQMTNAVFFYEISGLSKLAEDKKNKAAEEQNIFEYNAE